MHKIKDLLNGIYGEKTGETAFQRIALLIEKFPVRKKNKACFSQADVVLITYGDTLNQEGQPPLITLSNFADCRLKDAVSTIHFLPFFP